MTALEHYTTTTSTVKAHKTTFREEDSMVKIKGKSYERADQIIDKTNVKGNMKSNSNTKRQLVFQKIMSTTADDSKPRPTGSLRKFQSGKAYRRVIEISVVIVADKLMISSTISVQASTTNINIQLLPKVAVTVCWTLSAKN